MKKFIKNLLIIIFIFLILAIGGFFGYKYYKGLRNKKNSELFYSYVFQNNFKKLFDYSLEGKIINRVRTESYLSKTNVDFSNKFSNDSNLDLNKLTLKINTTYDKTNKDSNVVFNYSNNELFNLNILSNSKYIAIGNSDVLNSYIGFEKKSTSNVFKKLNSDINELSNHYSNLKNENKIVLNEENEFDSNIEDYVSYLKNNTKYCSFKDEGSVIVEQNGQKINTNAYSLTISKKDFFDLYLELTNYLENDDELLGSICGGEITVNEVENFESSLDFKNVVVTKEEEIYSLRGEESQSNKEVSDNYETDFVSDSVAYIKISQVAGDINKKIDEIKDKKTAYNAFKYMLLASSDLGISADKNTVKKELVQVFKKLNEVLAQKIDDNDEIKIIVYVSDNKTVKINALFGKKMELVIDYLKNETNSNMTKITISEKIDDYYNGYVLTLSKNKTTAIDDNTIELGIINKSEIVNKYAIIFNIEGSSNSNSFNNSLSFSYSGKDGKFSCNFSNDLKFGNNQVDVIHRENTLLIDKLQENDFYYFMNKMNSRIDTVYEEKMSKLNLISKNNSDTILRANDQDDLNTENRQEKEQIIDLLVDTISKEMGKAKKEGKEYSIKDLKDLKIEGYEIQVSVSNEIALVKINNYTFKIDKDFNLSE